MIVAPSIVPVEDCGGKGEHPNKPPSFLQQVLSAGGGGALGASLGPEGSDPDVCFFARAAHLQLREAFLVLQVAKLNSGPKAFGP